MVKRAFLAMILCVFIPPLSGCDGANPSARSSPSATKLTIPTDGRIKGAAGDVGALQGVLQGRRNSDGSACFWVDGPNVRAFIILRAGSYATPGLGLREAGGSREAHVGQTYLFLGAEGAPRTMKGCPERGAPYYASDIADPQPQYSRATLEPRSRTDRRNSNRSGRVDLFILVARIPIGFPSHPTPLSPPGAPRSSRSGSCPSPSSPQASSRRPSGGPRPRRAAGGA